MLMILGLRSYLDGMVINMIIEFILSLFFRLIEPLLEMIPDLANSMHLSFDAIDTFFDYLSIGLYIIPINTFTSIFKIIISVQLFRVITTIIRTLWNLLPFV